MKEKPAAIPGGTPLSNRRPQKGASSVLMLMVLLLLVFLAVLSFVTTGANLRLARRNADTVAAWYRMDTMGEQTVARIRQSILRADEETAAWLGGNRFLDGGQLILPDSVKEKLLVLWASLEDESSREQFRKAMYRPVHTVICELAVENLSLDGVEVLHADRERIFLDALAEAEPKSPASGGPSEQVGAEDGEGATRFLLRLEDPDKVATGSLEAVLELIPAANGSEGGHLRILEWKLVQPPFAYKNQIKLWEGIVE